MNKIKMSMLVATMLCTGALQIAANADEITPDNQQSLESSSTINDNKESLENELSTVQTQITATQQEIDQKVSDSQSYYQNEVLPAKNNVDELSGKYSQQETLTQQLQDNQEKLSSLNTQNQNLENEIQNINDQINTQQEIVNDKQNELSQEQIEINNQQQKLSNQKQDLETQLNNTNTQLTDLSSQKDTIQNQFQSTTSQIQEINNQQQNTENQINDINQEQEAIQTQITNTTQNLSSVSDGDVTNGNSNKLLNYMTDEWVNQFKNHGTDAYFDDDVLTKMNNDLGVILGDRHVQYNYVASDKDNNWNITITPNTPLDHDVLLELTRFTTQILNPLRERVGSQPYEINEGSLQIANNIKVEYEKDGFSIYSGKGHDQDALLRVSTQMLTKPGTDNQYNYISESYSGGFINGMRKPLKTDGTEDWYTNKVLDYPDTRTVTMADIKKGIYNGIRIMLFADSKSRWGHTTDLLGTQHPERISYVGTSLDALGQVHINAVSPGKYSFDDESLYVKLSNTKYSIYDDSQKQNLITLLKQLTDKVNTLSNIKTQLTNQNNDLSINKQQLMDTLSNLDSKPIDTQINALLETQNDLQIKINNLQSQINSLVTPEFDQLQKEQHKLVELQSSRDSLINQQKMNHNQLAQINQSINALQSQLIDIAQYDKYVTHYDMVTNKYNQLLDDITNQKEILASLKSRETKLKTSLSLLQAVNDTENNINVSDNEVNLPESNTESDDKVNIGNTNENNTERDNKLNIENKDTASNLPENNTESNDKLNSGNDNTVSHLNENNAEREDTESKNDNPEIINTTKDTHQSNSLDNISINDPNLTQEAHEIPQLDYQLLGQLSDAEYNDNVITTKITTKTSKTDSHIPNSSKIETTLPQLNDNNTNGKLLSVIGLLTMMLIVPIRKLIK